MAGPRRGMRRRFNWRLAVGLLLGLGILGGGLYGVRHWRRQRRAARGLESGLKAYDAKDWAAAAGGLGAYLALHGDDTEVYFKYAVAQHHLWLQTGFRVRSHRDQAVHAYRRVLRKDPAHAEAAVRVSSLYSPGEAEMVLSQFLAATPHNVEALMRRAVALEGLGRYKDAEADLLAVIKRAPADIRAYAQLARLTREREEVRGNPEAILRKAVEENRTSAVAHSALRDYLVRWRTGGPEERKKSIDEADKAAENALKSDPTNVPLALYVADIKRSRREFREAHAILDRLASANPAVIAAKVDLLMVEGKAAMALTLCDELVHTQKNVPSHLLRARAREAVRQFDKAREDYEAVTRLQPENPQSWIMLGRFHAGRKEIDEASKALKHALEIDETHPQTVLFAVPLYERSPDPETRKKGEELLKRALEARPAEIGLRAFKAERLIKRRSREALEEAQGDLQKVLDQLARRDPSFQPAFRASVWGLMAQTRIFLGLPEAALDAVAGGLKALADRPNEAWRRKLLFLKADAERMRWPALAVATLRPLWEKDNNDLEVGLALTRAYLAAKEPQKAIPLLRTIKSRWDVTRVNMALAESLDAAGSGEEALKTAREAGARAPDDPRPLFLIVRLLSHADRREEIKSTLSDWHKAHPKDAVTVAGAAGVLVATSHSLMAGANPEDEQIARAQRALETAQQVAEMAVEQHPADVGPTLTLANICQTRDRIDEAEKLYREVLSKSPDHPVAINNLAWLLCEERKAFKEALALADRCRERFPRFPEMIDTRGVIYYRMGRLEDAGKEFVECIRLAFPNARTATAAQFHLARVLDDQGRDQEAVERLKSALARDSSAGGLPAEDRKEAEALLDKLTGG